jgi:hypothetical protein
MILRLLSTPLLSTRERALLFTLLVFDASHAPALLESVSGASGERLREQLQSLARPELKTLVIELRRMIDQRFEGLTALHSSWLLAPISQESEPIRQAWLAELPTALQGESELQRAPLHLLALLRVLLTKKLVEMPPEPREKVWHRRHLPDLPEALWQRLTSQLPPRELGSALADLGEELARKVAQRLTVEQGLLVLAGYHEPIEDAIFLLLRVAEKIGLALER